MNIKNPLFITNGGFFVLENFVGEGDRANAKPYKHTDDCSTKSDWDSAEWRSRWGGVGAVKALLLYCRTPF